MCTLCPPVLLSFAKMQITTTMALYSRYRISVYATFSILFLLVIGSSWKVFKGRPQFIVNSDQDLPPRPLDDVTTGVSSEILHGIMFDAGSTGTRIHVFTFERVKGGSLRLVTEYFQQTKPGLSSYANEPEKAVESVQFLLQHARREVLYEKWPQTPVALKATAGLRLLPENQANVLLEKVKDVLSNSPFKTSGDFVSIMDGVDEGVYAWMTVNFLLGRLTGLQETVGIVDLGGGSCQITFLPQEQKTLDTAPDAYLRNLKLFGSTFEAYTHSYLGLGLMAARSKILSLGKLIKGDDKKKVISSQCFLPDQTAHWSYGNVEYEISGSQDFSFSACLDLIRPLVKSVQSQNEVNSRQFYVFSYFLDLAVTAGLIDEEKGGILSVADYIAAAQEKGCVESSKSRQFPFMCLDLSYMIALLRDGFGFNENKTFTLKKKIKDTEVSWALGATLHMFDHHGYTES